MSMDRFDEVTIGHACEVEGCSIVCTTKETRCYDHSVMRYIGSLFDGETCCYIETNCTRQATVSNEHDVPMCESCHNIYQSQQARAQNLNLSSFEEYQRSLLYQGVVNHLACVCNNAEHSQFNQECPMNEERDVCWGYIGPCDNYAVTTVAHPSNGGQVPMCSRCADRSFFTMSTPHFDSLESLFPGY